MKHPSLGNSNSAVCEKRYNFSFGLQMELYYKYVFKATFESFNLPCLSRFSFPSNIVHGVSFLKFLGLYTNQTKYLL